ncbi:signal peptidase II [Tautonia rosea]|uniref:signal peptidase II n=1 Tax=Tautonia rosea TaxID=2728037 RepID=UPI001F451539|nr:signal peptidase II [Tautonia rosea]
MAGAEPRTVSASTGNPSIPVSRWLLFWGLALGGSAFDLITKAVVFQRVGPPGSPAVSVLGKILELRTSYNTGALWGIGGNLPFGSLMFAVLSIVAGVFILYWLFVLRNATDRWQTAALGLIMAGAIGNCYDRLRFGHVRDFVHVHVDSINFDFPIFNFADNMLVIGAVTLMLLAFREDPPVSEHAEPSARKSSAPPQS